MNTSFLSILLLLPGLIFFSSLLPVGAFKRLTSLYNWIKTGIYLALVAGVSSTVWITLNGNTEHSFFEMNNLGLSVRLDSLSTLMYSMIAIIGLVVVRYSRNYLDGEKRHELFISKLAFTIAFVQLLVISGNLATLFIAWVGTSIGLHQLLIFYPERKRAQLAARKKFVIARLGDLALLGAFALIYQQFGTGHLSDIFKQTENLSATNIPIQLEIAGILLVLSASLKSVQIPFHGWLLDVMETPTPVSALLHAGLLNAGPFLIIRFAYLMDLTSFATVTLVIIGAASALFGALTASTQPTIKTALAYSSVGHMGFTLMVCGLGVYSASLLHLVAHSFYKAHAFLSSGSIIEKVQTKNASNHSRSNHEGKALLGVITAALLFFSFTFLWIQGTHIGFQMIVIAGIIFLGVLSLHINTFDSNNRARSVVILLVASSLVINSFFFLEHSISLYLGSTVPEVRIANETMKITAISIISLFGLTVITQSWSTTISNSPFFRRLEIHLRNGLYLNHLFNRMMNSLNLKTTK